MQLAIALLITVAVGSPPSADADLPHKVSLPKIDDLITQATKKLKGPYNLGPRCSGGFIKKDECEYIFKASPPTCVALRFLLGRLLNNDQTQMTRFSQILTSRVAFRSLSVNVCKKTMSLAAETTGSLDIIPNMLTLHSATFTFTLTVPDKCIDISLSGSWSFRGITIPVTVKNESGIFTIEAKPSITHFNLGKLVGRDTGGSMELDDLSVDDPVITARFQSGRSEIRFVFKSALPSLGRPEFYVTLIHQKNSGSHAVVIAGIFSNVNVADLIKKLTKADLSRIPIIGSATASARMIYSSGDKPNLHIPYANNVLDPLFPAEKGLKLMMSLKIKNFPEQAISLYVRNKTDFRFKFVGLSGLGVKDFIGESLSKLANGLKLKGMITSVLNQKLSDLLFSIRNKTMTFNLRTSKAVTIIPRAIVLQNTTARIDFQISSRKVGIEMATVWNLGNFPIWFKIVKPADLSSFTAVARPGKSLPFGKLIENFAVALLPSGLLENAVKKAGLESFLIKNPSILLYFSQDSVVKVSGTAVIGEWTKCHVEVMTGQMRGATVMAAGITLQRVPLTAVVKKLTDNFVNLGIVPGASLLDNTSISIVMSSEPIPTTIPLMQFSDPSLSNIEIQDGISLVGNFRFPDCGSDKFCKVAKGLLGADSHFILKGRLALGRVFLSALIPKQIQLFRGINITDVGFEVEAGNRNAIGITGSLKLKKPPLTFTGSIGVSESGAYLQMTMIGMWKYPFGVPFLAIGDIHLGVSLFPDALVISALEFGGTALLGKFEDDKADPIKAKMFIGLNRINPNENFFMGNISALTIRALLAAFAYKPSLPGPIADSGFPKGLYISFSASTKMLKNGVVIPRGFYLHGVLKILFFELDANVRISFNGLLIDLTVNPFDIGKGLVKVSGRDSETGPRLLVDVGWNPPRALINIEGSVTVLKITAYVNITISTSGLEFHLRGDFLGLFQCELYITSSYNDLKTKDFQVAGVFRADLLGALSNGVRNILDNYKKLADKAISSAQDKLERNKKLFDKAAEKMTDLQYKLNEQKAKFDKAVAYLESKKRFFESKKKVFDSAKSKFTSAQQSLERKKAIFDGAVRVLNEKVKKICPSACRKRRSTSPDDVFLPESEAKGYIKREKRGWRRRFRVRIRLPNPVEKAREAAKRVAERTRETAERAKESARKRAREIWCAGRRAIRATCLGAISVAKAAVNTAKRGLDAAKLVFEGAKKVMDAAKLPMEAAKGLVSVAQLAVNKAKALVDVAVVALEGAKRVTKSLKVSVDLAIAGLEGVKKVHNLGISIAQKIVTFGLENMFNIKKISFRVRLSLAETGKFFALVTAKIMGKTTTFSFHINLKSVTDMIGRLADKVKHSLGFGKKRSVEESSLPAIRNLGARVLKGEQLQSVTDDCALYEEVTKISRIVVNDTDGLTDTIHELSRRKPFVKDSSAVTGQDIDDLLELASDALLVGLEAVTDLVAAETEMTEHELKEMLKSLATGRHDDCLKTVAQILHKILGPTSESPSEEEIGRELKKLPVAVTCLDEHACASRD